MPNNLFNWTFNDIVRFLKVYGFSWNYTKGSHYFYVGNYKKQFRQVCIPFHGNKSINPKTLKGIILQSGIEKEKWLTGC